MGVLLERSTSEIVCCCCFLAHSCACTMNEYREGPKCGHFL